MDPLLEIRELCVTFPVHGGVLRRPRAAISAVDRVSFEVYAGETFGIVGESGCGKTTLGRTIVRLYKPTSGTIRYRGAPIEGLGRAALRPLRRDLQMIFQDPFASLNPRMTVAAILEEPLRVQGIAAEERGRRIWEIAELVGLRIDDLHRYPHEFSGGQRQRVCIARALVLHPRVVVADEPVSALDVSVQAQVLNLLVDLQRRLALTYLFISHDLAVVKYVADRIGVMYLGRLVEVAPATPLYGSPAHPYTRALIAAVPSLRAPRRHSDSPAPAGEPPSPMDPPRGCAYDSRCPYVRDRCRTEIPYLRPLRADAGRLVACHFAEEF